MKSLFDYIDGNSFLTTIIGIIVGWILNFISTMYFDKKNKPELQIDKNNSDNNINMEIFIGTFKVEYSKEKEYKINYSQNIKNKKNHCYKDIIIKNIGKSDIECLDIVSTNKKGLILCDYNSLNDLVDNKLICYDYCYDKKIRVGESIKIRIYYEYNKQPHLMWSSTLAFLFEDQNHNYWEQPFFYEKDNIYAPYEISYKELKKAVTTDDAYECFEHPWLW